MSPSSLKSAAVDAARIRLRRLVREDLPSTLAWRNDERSRKWFKSQDLLQPDAHAAWFERFMSSKSRDCMFFAEMHDGTPVGQTSIYNFNPELEDAEVGRFLSDPALRGQGFFRDALLLTLAHAFDALNLRTVHLEVFRNNARAIRLYESVGFIEEPRVDREILGMRLSREDFHNRHSADAGSMAGVGAGSS